ncbi:MAG: hypothetical protein RLZZ461_1186, partial [Planctomycetota bacterium]
MTTVDLELDDRPPALRARHLAEYLSMRALAAAMQCVDPEINLKTAGLIGSVFAA